ncbi:MAG: hypothetical protein RLY86_2619, partial [Pseudomonadota bacterium]
MNASATDRAKAPLAAGAVLTALLLASTAAAQPVQLTPPPQQSPAQQAPAGAPTRLVPFGQTPPFTQTPAPTAPAGIQVEALGALSADTGGPLTPANGGLPAEAWAGTARPLADGLIATLPEQVRSAALRRALVRLFLSDLVPPAGSGGDRGFAGRRLEALARTGLLDAARDLAVAVPPSLDDGPAALALFQGRVLAGDTDTACLDGPDYVKRFADPAFQKLMIACQVRNGETAAATLGVDMLREQGNLDEPFLLLAESAAAGRTAAVKGVARPTPTQLALILASKRSPDAETRVTAPASLVALARAAEAPMPLRLAAAEQAAMLGLLAPADLGAVYQSVSIPAADLKDPLTAVQKRSGAQARALLVQALRNADSIGVKAELLRAAVDAGDAALLSGSYGAVLMQEIGQVPPGIAYGFLAPFAARVSLLQGRVDLARAWVEIARADAVSGNADPVPYQRLWPIALLNGLARPGDMPMEEWLAGVGAVPEDADATARAGSVLALLAAAGQPVDPAVADSLLLRSMGTAPTLGGGGQGGGADAGGAAGRIDPLVAARLGDAAAQGRMGETLLLT